MILTTLPAIERTLDLRASPARVWRALTDSSELAQWFGQAADLRPEVGYDGWMQWDGHGRYAMRVEEAVEPTRFVVRWMNEPGLPLDPATSTLVEWDLEPLPGGGTRLHLRESGFRQPDARAGNNVGWLSELGELVELLASEPWEAGIRRTYRFTSSIDEVLAAFVEPARFQAWWGGGAPDEMRAGAEGWWEWPSHGRFAFRIERVEPPSYLAWTWAVTPGVPLDEAPEVLRTEWAFASRDDGGTDLTLLETGFIGPENHAANGSGWDGDVSQALRQALGEAPESPPPG